MLFFIGYGLSDFHGLTLDALHILKSADKIFFEIYTNFQSEKSIDSLTQFLRKPVIPLERKSLENNSKEFLNEIRNLVAALIISGDPFIATTHHVLWLEAIEMDIDVKIINNVSIYSLVPSITGLFAYKFGKMATIPFSENPSTVPLDTLIANQSADAHSLFLLDINVVENRFLDISQALKLLLAQVDKYPKNEQNLLTAQTTIIGISRLGMSDSRIIAGPLSEIQSLSWSNYGPPQVLVIPAKLHFIEQEFLFKVWSNKSAKANCFYIQKPKIVVTGTFELLHPGHLQFFHEAKKLLPGAELWVVVARDSSVKHFKNRDAILSEQHRLQMVQSLEIVDYALLGNEGPDKIKIIEELNPDIVALGYDQWMSLEKLQAELLKRGLKTKVHRLERYGNASASSSEIRRKIAEQNSKAKDSPEIKNS